LSKSLDTVGNAALRRTLLYIRGQSGPVTAAQVAQALSVPVTVARWRLEKLVGAELVRSAFERRGRGRPAKTYLAAPQTAQIEFPPRRYETLVSLLMRRRKRGDLHKIGKEFGRELAHSAGVRRKGGLDELCRSLGKLGFQASASEDGTEIVSATCPMRPLVVADPEARAIDEGLWSGLVEAALGGATATCTTHGCLDGDGPCRIAVELAHQ
jgi:predicted ArsR family transcriptional regulator